ncbi:MAG: Gfo/Idh/MocA family oxidoreductase [Verrucomicrobiales bacterium]|nr:Gfo/Idh/MocA family oxidoreductase [Verrucomicrobiales bacterium]
MTLNIGLIGFGKMGQTRLESIVSTGKGTVLVAHDPHAQDFRGIRSVATAEEVISDPRLDAVFIATPNFQNRPYTLAALAAGKHVFCEKPPAFTGQEVLEIQRAEKASGRKLMYGFNHRHHGSIRAMKAMVESGKYGRLLWMRGRYGKSVDKNYFSTWRAKKDLAGGGILLDQGIHMLDLFLLLAGDFDEVQGMVSSLYWRLDGIEDNVFANFRNRTTGVVASLHSTMTQWRHLFSFEVFLERGHMVLNGLKTQSGSYGDEVLAVSKNRTVAPAATWEEEEKIVYHADNSWRDETEYFLDCIREDRPVVNGSSQDALRVMQLIDRIYQEERHHRADLHQDLLS